MFFSRSPPVISGGAALVQGRRYHVKRVLYTYEQLIDALTGRFGKSGKSVLTSHRTDLKGPYVWPHPAKERALKLWQGLAANYDVLGEGFTHLFPGGVTAKAYVLGKVWTVYDPRTGVHRTSQQKDLSALDTAPVIEIYGKDLPDGDILGLDVAKAEAVQRVAVRDLSRLKLSVSLIALETNPGHPQVAVTVRFPHEVYGEGEDWLRVRCVAPDGQELGTVGIPH